MSEGPPSEPLAAYCESAALGVGESKTAAAEVLPEDPILLAQVLNQVFLVAVQPPSYGEDEELWGVWHGPGVRRTHAARAWPLAGGPSFFGRFFAPYDIVQVTALFNYYNRLADGLGIDPEPEHPTQRRFPRPRAR